MLADIVVAKSVLGGPHLDLHRHAIFSCTLERVAKKLKATFSKG